MAKPRRRSSDSALRLEDLELDPKNANRGTDRGRSAIAHSLKAYGAGRSVVVDRHGRVIAGNKTVEEAKRQGIPVVVVSSNGQQLVVVQRKDLDLDSDQKAQALAIADNRTTELDLAWDPDVFKTLISDGLDLSALFTPDELTAIGGQSSGRAGENDVVEPGATEIVRGEAFILGRHRLLCGDATSTDDVARVLDGARPNLLTTDPPYGVQYDPAFRHRAHPDQRTAVGTVLNDDRASWTDAWALFTGDIAYVWHSALHADVVARDLREVGFDLRAQIIWRKQHFALGRGDYHWQHEPAWYGVRGRGRGRWRGDRTQSTVWDVPNLNPLGGARDADNAVTGHSTQKPVRLFEIPIVNHTLPNELVYDPFCGSGTALIAAEKLGRICYAIELDPRYVQAAVTRWETFTGQRAVRLPAEWG